MAAGTGRGGKRTRSAKNGLATRAALVIPARPTRSNSLVAPDDTGLPPAEHRKRRKLDPDATVSIGWIHQVTLLRLCLSSPVLQTPYTALRLAFIF